MNLVLVDVQQEPLARAVEQLAPSAAAIMTLLVDVSSAAQMEALAAAVHQRLTAPHLVFNNAGVGSGGLL